MKIFHLEYVGYFLLVATIVCEVSGVLQWYITIPLYAIAAILIAVCSYLKIEYNKEKSAIKLMLIAAAVDGNISNEEMDQISALVCKKNMSKAAYDGAVKDLKNENSQITIPADEEDKKLYLKYIGIIIKADSVITEEEEKYFKSIGKNLGLGEDVVNSLFAAL